MSMATDYQWMYENERTKFHAETLTTSYLSGLLRHEGARCTVCERKVGTAVRIDGSDRQWMCDQCARGEKPCGCSRFGVLVARCEQHRLTTNPTRDDAEEVSS